MAPAGLGSTTSSVSAIQWPLDLIDTSQDVPTIVHNLIRDMKALQSALDRWSRLQATPEDVSDCYVQFGVEFNAVVRAFEEYDIPTTDLHAIPTHLRTVLEECLGEEPSLDALDRYLPHIRLLLSDVLCGLRAKQPAWRNAAARPPHPRSYPSCPARLSSGSHS